MYETSLIFGFLGISFFLIYFADQFKIEGESPWLALFRGAISTLLKLLGVATLIFNVFFIKLILQDQTVSPTLTHILNVYDMYLNLIIYGFVIFFVIYFLHQFTLVALNYNVAKGNREKKLGED